MPFIAAKLMLYAPEFPRLIEIGDWVETALAKCNVSIAHR
jgi:hypothetical protein